MSGKYFHRIYIEITNRCNLQCSFCPTDGRPARMLSVKEFEYPSKSLNKLMSNVASVLLSLKKKETIGSTVTKLCLKNGLE